MTLARLLPHLSFLAVLAFSPLAAQEHSLSDVTEAWLAGPHSNYRSESFTHWNEEGEVPPACAACHSETGVLDWLGTDGSGPLSIDQPATINTVIGCAACHVSEAEALDAVPFPSGVTIDRLGTSATCSLCHQGRAATDTVAAATDGLPPDEIAAELGFINVHYGVAAAVMHGADVRGGFQYEGQTYVGRFAHVPSAGTCVACHEPHTTEVATDGCVACHQGITEISAIRTRHADFDGDGAVDTGIRDEIAGVHAILYRAIQAYAQQITGVPIGYTAHSYPYFFNDSNGDGTIGDAESVFPNRYASWTPRLLQAAYNYQMVAKDGGAWVHNPAYALQILHDSVKSLSERVEIDTDALVRP
jgi:hypothetical protein